MAWAGWMRALAAPPLPLLRWGSSSSSSRRGLLPLSAAFPAGASALPGGASGAASLGARGISVDQLHRRGPFQWRRRNPGPTEGRPQLKAVVLRTMTRKPKKPNSANRKCCRVRLSTGKEAVAFIPGEGHNLQEHSVVLVEGGRTQDLPGVKLKVVRGKFDCARVQKKKQQ